MLISGSTSSLSSALAKTPLKYYEVWWMIPRHRRFPLNTCPLRPDAKICLAYVPAPQAYKKNIHEARTMNGFLSFMKVFVRP